MPAAVNGMKECSKCHEVKAVVEFHKNKAMTDGFCNQCISCSKERSKKYFKENRDKLLEKEREYRKTEKGKESARRGTRKWRENNRDAYLENQKKYRKSEKYKASHKKWWEEYKTRPEVIERQRRIREQQRVSGKRREYVERYIEKNYEKYRSNYLKVGKKVRDSLSESYIKRTISQLLKVKTSDLPISKEWFDVKRTLILVERELKEYPTVKKGENNERTISTCS